jgi:hypothetical protein
MKRSAETRARAVLNANGMDPDAPVNDDALSWWTT